MSPTIVTKDGKPVMVVGTPGGSRIITAVLHTILNAVDYGMDVQEAVDAPRFHQQWLPGPTNVELFALSPDTRKSWSAWATNSARRSRRTTGGDPGRRASLGGQAGGQQPLLRRERPAPQHRAGGWLLIVIARSNKVASAGASHCDASAALA